MARCTGAAASAGAGGRLKSLDLTVSDIVPIDLGGRSVEVPAQRPDDLVAWTPDAKALWLGTMIQALSSALPRRFAGRHKDPLGDLAPRRDVLPTDHMHR